MKNKPARGAKLNKENEKGGNPGPGHNLSQRLRPIHEFSTFFKKAGVSPSGGIKVFKECDKTGR